MTRAADLAAEGLVRLGFDRMFLVPGESYLPLLDALAGREEIDLVTCRHEGGAGMAALADAKLTGRPGLVAVSRGPGAANVAIAVHSAQQDACPLLVLVGQVARHERGRGAFQEVDYPSFFGAMAKGVWEVNRAEALPETLSRAWAAAMSGTPGPAIVALPEDMLAEDVADPAPIPEGPPALSRPAPPSSQIEAALALLAGAQRPLIIAGGGCEAPAARAALSRAAAALGAPVATSFRRQHVFDNASPLYAGNLGFKIPPALVGRLAQADLVLAVGTRLGDVPTQGYRFPRAPVPEQPLIHVHPDPGTPGRVHRPTLAVAAEAEEFLTALAAAAPPPPAARADWAAACNAAALRLRGKPPQTHPDGPELGRLVQALAVHAPKDLPLSLDAGNFSAFVMGLWPFDGTTRCIGAVGGAMGIGVPGALAACLRREDRRALAFCGDGGALMTGNELAAAVAKGGKPIIVVADNATYGTIRMHQERDHPGRVAGTDLANPDFAAWGESFGALGLTFADAAEAESVAARAFAHDGPVVIHARVSTEAITPFTTIRQLRGDA